jgi:hypothetical protein
MEHYKEQLIAVAKTAPAWLGVLQYLGNLSTWTNFGHGWANRIANNLIRGAS